MCEHEIFSLPKRLSWVFDFWVQRKNKVSHWLPTFMSFEFTEKIMSDLSVTKNICPKCVVAECPGLLICVYKINNRCKYQIPTKKIYKSDLPTKEILKSLYNLPFQSIMFSKWMLHVWSCRVCKYFYAESHFCKCHFSLSFILFQQSLLNHFEDLKIHPLPGLMKRKVRLGAQSFTYFLDVKISIKT